MLLGLQGSAGTEPMLLRVLDVPETCAIVEAETLV